MPNQAFDQELDAILAEFSGEREPRPNPGPAPSAPAPAVKPAAPVPAAHMAAASDLPRQAAPAKNTDSPQPAPQPESAGRHASPAASTGRHAVAAPLNGPAPVTEETTIFRPAADAAAKRRTSARPAAPAAAKRKAGPGGERKAPAPAERGPAAKGSPVSARPKRRYFPWRRLVGLLLVYLAVLGLCLGVLWLHRSAAPGLNEQHYELNSRVEYYLADSAASLSDPAPLQ